MAAFVLLLTFFEPHGDCLSQRGNNGEKFKRGFDSFMNYLNSLELGIENEEQINRLKKQLWENARCGAFHALTPRGVTVDLFDNCDSIFTIYNNKFIVNVNLLSTHLINYLNNFFNQLSDEAQVAFEAHYNDVILKQAQQLAN